MAKLDEFKRLVGDSSLASGDKEVWIGYANGLPDFFLDKLVLVFTEMPEVIGALTQNLKLKTAALKSGDKEEWQRILENEKEIFGRLSEKTN